MATSLKTTATASEIEEQKQLGVLAQNTRYQAYEEVSKPTYNLAQKEEEIVVDGEFATVDFGLCRDGGAAGRTAFAAQLGGALQRDGFAILVNHGCDGCGGTEAAASRTPTAAQDLYTEAHRRIEELFLALTPAQRASFAAQRHGAVNQGFFALKKTSNIHPDLV